MKQYKSKKAETKIINTYNELVERWGVAVEEIDVNTRYGRTHVLSAGNSQGQPIIMFHGVGDDSALMWIYNAKRLGEDFKLYAVDTIGGPGKSECGIHYTSEFDDVVWIDDIMNGLKLERASFIGVSHGGYLVQMYTAMRKERVDKAISISGAIAAGEKKSSMKIMMKIFLPEALLPTDKNIIKLMKKLSGTNYKVFVDNSLILEHYKWLLRGFNNMAMGYHKIETFSGEKLETIREKVKFLVGEEDSFEKYGGKRMLEEKKPM